ncbi:MAG: Spermidine/putrescine import ATP-binding protein PotA [Chloroflexi bacterium ADurb.Bin360]|nr:MAG: Spermidine/putrescine import ATP-binding protein PotA [Chloroflexi bacterium ADurb.Bin360]
MNFLELTNIHKSYDNAPLLCGVNFSVERGEIACLLGSSGSGKTTLLRILAGLEETEVGRVLLEGQDITQVPAHKRGVVLMFQDYALFPHKTVAENVAFGLRYKPVEDRGPKTRRAANQTISEKVEAMLALVGLEGFANRDVNSLSGGERQRVALARSLAPHPRLLLLDEPLGALDRNLRERLLEELPTILRQVDVTAITVTHDQEEAFALADRVILLHEGQVVQQGAPETVYAAPANAWVARFLGLQNLFPAKVVSAHRVEVPFGVLDIAEAITLPLPGSTGTVLVQPWGIQLTDSGSPRARVSKRSFHGSYYRLELDCDGTILSFTQDLRQPAPGVGTELAFSLDPFALRWLE